MEKRIAQKVDPKSIPEVVEFLEAKSILDEFRAEHAAVFDMFGQLVQSYNAKLEQAEKVCRGRKISSGPFDLYSFTTKYDPEVLYNALGKDKFLEVGGKIVTKTVYEVDKNAIEGHIAKNKIAADVVEKFRKESPSFHKPDALTAP